MGWARKHWETEGIVRSGRAKNFTCVTPYEPEIHIINSIEHKIIAIDVHSSLEDGNSLMFDV
jgi:hypothetical protein